MNATGTGQAEQPYVQCSICYRGSLNDSNEVGIIKCNVRKFASESFTVWRCTGCGSLHCKEAIDFARYYLDYPLDDQKLKYLTRCAYSNRMKILRRAALRHDDSILDYGCGGGLFLNFLRNHGHADATGFDPYSTAFRQEPVSGKRFDFVYSFGVIEHTPCPREFLREQRRWLKDSGTLVVATPDAGGLNIIDPDAVLMHQPYHRHILSIDAIKQLADSEGLEFVRLERRNWMDTIHPGMNGRFVSDYVTACGGLIDSLFEPRQVGRFLKTPRLWFSFWFGYWFPQTGYMICQFRAA